MYAQIFLCEGKKDLQAAFCSSNMHSPSHSLLKENEKSLISLLIESKYAASSQVR
jgi:hypothetical protein